MHFERFKKSGANKKNKLLIFTVFLLFVIVILITTSLFIFIFQLQTQNNYGRIINISGRQRMICQKITKGCLLILQKTDSLKHAEKVNILKTDLFEFQENNSIIKNFNKSTEITNCLKRLKVPLERIVENTEKIIDNADENGVMATKIVLDTEPVFLVKMNEIVKLFEEELKSKQSRFKNFIIVSNISLIIIFITIIVLLIIPKIKQAEKIKKELKISVNELSTLNQTKDKFFKIIAHDLINPFNSLLGFSYLLQTNLRNYDYNKIDQMLEIMYVQSQNVYSLLINLLEWAKTQTGGLVLKPDFVNLENLFKNVEMEIKSIAETKKIVLKFNSAKKVTLYADNNVVRLILRNLITNAIKFSKSGSVVQVYAEEKHKFVEFTVSDKGIGLKNEEKQNLFNLKTDLIKQGTANEKGTGLGLNICKELVEKHGGEIWVESSFGKGSDFKFTIPKNKTGVLKESA